MDPDTLALHQRLKVHAAHHHLLLLAPIQPPSAPIRASASLTGLSRRQITALTLSLLMQKGRTGAMHKKQGCVSPQLQLTQCLKYGTGQLPQIPACWQEIEKVIKAQQIQLQ